MFAGSVTRITSTPASPIFNRVLSSRFSYSSLGNAAIRHLLGRLPAQQHMLEHALSSVEIVEVDPLVWPVRRLLDVAGSEQNAWYPRAVNEEARITRRSPRRDLARDSGFGHRGGHRLHELVVVRCLKGQISRTRDHIRFEPWQPPPCKRDRGFQLTQHLLGGLTRVDAPVDLDLAAVRYDVGARAAVDRAHGQARRPELGMGLTRELIGDRFELEHDRGGSGHGVASEGRR